MTIRVIYLENTESRLPHAFVDSRSLCGLVDLKKTRTVFVRISRARAEDRGVCVKCQTALEHDRRLAAMDRLVESLSKRRQED